MLEAYGWPQSVDPGDEVALHVSSDPARPFTVTVARDGATFDVVWTGSGDASHHPAPEGASAQGCAWPAAMRIPVGADWRSGLYLISVTAGDEQADAFLVVRPGRGVRAPVLMVLGTSTWNAYNDWGGPSLYTGGTRVSFERPLAPGFLTKPEPARRKAQDEPDREALGYFGWAAEHGAVELERRGRMAHVGAAVPALGRGRGYPDRRGGLAGSRGVSRPAGGPPAVPLGGPRRVLVARHARDGRAAHGGAVATPRSSPATPATGRSGSSTTDGP